MPTRAEKKWRQQEQDEKKAQLSFFEEDAAVPDWEQAADVRDAFLVLEEDEQLIVGLSVFGGYTSSEIGAFLGKPAATVRSRRSRALGKMSLILKE